MGYLATANFQNLHNDTKILSIKSHLNMLGTQFFETALVLPFTTTKLITNPLI